MALAVGAALREVSPEEFAGSTLEGRLRRTFVKWLNDPDNVRAPGMTCLTACERLEMPMPWTQVTVADSKGYGANIRVAPVGLVQNITDETRAAIAQFQAALTHGHPSALAASNLTVWAVADLASGGDPRGLPGRLRAYAESQREFTIMPGSARSGSARSRRTPLILSHETGRNAWAF
jgi:ADP-ribosylglycohydrolase